MTSEIEALKTNEFLRRRKLRLQQVREQSKDIAKHIRQRAKLEKLRKFEEVGARKQYDYIDRQEKLVRHLELLYANGIKNVGASHKKASEITLTENITTKVDLSKIRAKEAAALLRLEKQQKLDEHKKLLDRKLQAREIANEISRDKSKTVSSQLKENPLPIQSNKCSVTKKESSSSVTAIANNVNEGQINNNEQDTVGKPVAVIKSDMATQWSYEELPGEWDPMVPKLDLRQHDVISKQTSARDKNKNSQNSKRPNLFAVSDDMPNTQPASSYAMPNNVEPAKSSLTLITEYIKQKTLNLREPSVSSIEKEHNDDLQSIKQTILRSKMTHPSGNVCLVQDEQVIQVPSWNPENCVFCSQTNFADHKTDCIKANNIVKEKFCMPAVYLKKKKPIKSNITCAPSNYGDTKSLQRKPKLMPKVKLDKEQSMKLNLQDQPVPNKSSVTVYNHSTRDSKHLHDIDNRLVIRDEPLCNNAYSLAMKEVSETKIKEHDKNLQNMRNKVAMSKQNIEKEYKDTLAFLKSMSKDKLSNANKLAFKSEQRQQELKDSRQRKMCKVFQKIETECRRQGHSTVNANKTSKSAIHVDDYKYDSDAQDFQYSWMPVPEGDASLAVHTIPTTVKETKPSKGVKFSKIDSYHEYRSQHKHTPPTKDTTTRKSPPKKSPILNDLSKSFEDSEEDSDILSCQSQGDARKFNKRQAKLSESSSSQGIIVYRIIDSKSVKDKTKKRKKVVIKNLKNKETDREQQLVGGIFDAGSDKMDNFSTIGMSAEAINTSDSEGTSKRTQSNINNEHEKTEKECGVPSDSVLTKCSCNKKTEVYETESLQQVSQATSTVSSAPITAKVPLISANTSFIKVLNEDGQESGKFFIGASGFLDKENYEVVIQLKKREIINDMGEKPAKKEVLAEKTKIQDKLAEEKSKELSLDVQQEPTPAKNTIEQNPETVKISERNVIKEDEQPHIQVQQRKHELKQTALNTSEAVKQDDENIRFDTLTQLKEQICNEDIPVKSSTATQTQSFSNYLPTTRPPLFHLSSSTSTCYMSPPDKIMPKYLYNGTRKGSFNEEYCSKCHHKHVKSRRSRKSSKPLTTRQNDSTKTISDLCLNKKSRLNKKQQASFKQSKDYFNFVPIKNYDSQFKRKNSHAKLNPAIQNYINKLLGMSAKSLKALEVYKQDCSSVSTPTESTINIPSNYPTKPKSVDLGLSLHQIQSMLQQIISDNCYKMPIKNAKYHINTRKKLKPLKSGRMKMACPQSKSNKKQTVISLSPKKREDTCVTSENDAPSPLSSGFYSTTKSIADNNKQHMPTGEDTDSNIARESLLSYKTASKSHPKSQANVIKVAKSKKSNNAEILSSKESYISNNKKSKHIKQPKESDSQDLSNISTQTASNVKSRDLINLTATKIQNMEKIADLTEKCTHRLFNLAKVLEEVRKKKLTTYNHMSSDSSSEDQKPNQPEFLIKSTSLNSLKLKDDKVVSLTLQNNTDTVYSNSESQEGLQKPTSLECDKLSLNISRRKPPPAMSRINLKDSQADISPHELSTVAEVDSPISSKVKSKSFQNEDKSTISQISLNDSLNDIKSKKFTLENDVYKTCMKSEMDNVNPDLLDLKLAKPRDEQSFSNTQQRTKMQMMNLQNFNKIMLKPFVSIEEYAKQCDASVLDDQFNMEDIPKESIVNDELSSLHSEGSLPDVIGELLKRNIISKPFEFESVSNVHSTSLSSDSSMTAIALSKQQNNKKNVTLKTKDVSETSDSLTMSSNQDLENVFKNIGLGWASSTLKKTKERLALSSSSNSSVSGICSKPPLNFDRHDAYMFTSEKNKGNKLNQSKNILKSSSHQQTSLTSLTVQEFLDIELAKKITFSKPGRDESEGEFISLCQTKMPEDMKNISHLEADIGSIDSIPNAIRARTSTPVQLYKCHTYHSSSSSHITNGLFSNVDDLSSVKITSGSGQNHTTTDKDDLTVPNCSLKLKKIF